MNYKYIIQQALREDIGREDITTKTFISRNLKAKAVVTAKQKCIICGLHIAADILKALDSRAKFTPKVREGQCIGRGKIIAYLHGNAQAILTAERTMLNFISLLSGIATKTKEYVNAIRPYKAKILDTRKTLPGLRMLEKYAVVVGGGYNHRISLNQMILVKDNHLKLIGGVSKLPKGKHKQTIEVEIKNLKELREALKLKPNIIMLDNMNIKDIKRAVQIRNNLSSKFLPKLEASGGINLKNIKQIASTGIDMISVGSLTHSVESIDLSLEIL